MTGPTIPDAAVEAAGHGLALQAWGGWEYVPDELRRLFLRDAKIALEAAYPHMAAQVLREAFHEFPLETITAPDNAVMWLKRRADQIDPT